MPKGGGEVTNSGLSTCTECVPRLHIPRETASILALHIQHSYASQRTDQNTRMMSLRRLTALKVTALPPTTALRGVPGRSAHTLVESPSSSHRCGL